MKKQSDVTAVLFTTHEAAVYCRLSPAFFTKARIEGKRANRCPPPPFLKLGRAVRYSKSDLDAWLLEHRRVTALPGGINE